MAAENLLPLASTHISTSHSRKADYFSQSQENAHFCNEGSSLGGNNIPTWGWNDDSEEEPVLGQPPPPPIEIEDFNSEHLQNHKPLQISEQIIKTVDYSSYKQPEQDTNVLPEENINELPEDVVLVADSNDPDSHKSFKIVQRLGKGAFGSVYKAVHLDTNYIVALKKIAVEDLDDIVQEITMLQTSKSPRVVRYAALDAFIKFQYFCRYYGHYFYDDYLWIVMEYCPVGSMSDIMLLVRDKGIDEKIIAAVCKAVLLGLNYLHHSKKVHRDIKPENILISQTGQIKLGDFGISSQLTSLNSKKISIVGTPHFMAPEIIQGSGYDSKADIWSLGITAIDLAQAEPPRFEIPSSKVIWMIPQCPPPALKNPQKFSPEFNHFIAYTLVKDPEKRPSAAQLLEHPFLIDGTPSTTSTMIQALLQEAITAINEAGSNEAAIKRAKARIKIREKEEKLAAQNLHRPTETPPPSAAGVNTNDRIFNRYDNFNPKNRRKRMIKGKLLHFFQRRPKKEDLVARGIYYSGTPRASLELSPMENLVPPETTAPLSPPPAPEHLSEHTLPPPTLFTPPLPLSPSKLRTNSTHLESPTTAPEGNIKLGSKSSSRGSKEYEKGIEVNDKSEESNTKRLSRKLEKSATIATFFGLRKGKKGVDQK